MLHHQGPGVKQLKARCYTIKSRMLHYQEWGVTPSRAGCYTIKSRVLHHQEPGVTPSRAGWYTIMSTQKIYVFTLLRLLKDDVNYLIIFYLKY